MAQINLTPEQQAELAQTVQFARIPLSQKGTLQRQIATGSIDTEEFQRNLPGAGAIQLPSFITNPQTTTPPPTQVRALQSPTATPIQTNLLSFDELSQQSVGRGLPFLFDTGLKSLEAGKQAIQRGDLTISEFTNQAADLAQGLTELANQLTTQGGGPANFAKGFNQRLSQFVNFDVQGGGIGTANFQDIKIPFTQREFTTLPANVLPTLTEINQGIIPVDILPPGAFERVQREEETRLADQRVPTDTQGLPEPGSRLIPDPQNPGQFIPIPVVGDVSQVTVPQTRDQSIIEAEARRQEEQQRRAFEAARALREQQLGALETSLIEQQQRQFGEFVPQAADILQTRGLLQTSELENVLGREQARLTGQTSDILAQARLGATDEEIGRIDEILRARQGLQQAGLERRFSIQDFERQASLARQIGSQATPQVGGGKGSRLGAGLTGAVGGASAGAAGGGLGAALGGIAGGIGGFLS